MALEIHDVRKLVELRALYPDGTSCLILGDCFFHFSRGQLAGLCGDRSAVASTEAVQLADIAAALRFDTVETVDLFGDPTIRFDLQSNDIPGRWLQQFDWVIDAGTLYCCFNISNVLQNVLRFLKPSGAVFHLGSLVGHLGRGYYSLSPMLFADFYEQNGFEIVQMGVRVKPRHVDRERRPMRSLIRRIERRLGLNRTLDRPRGWRLIGRRDFFVASAAADALEFTDSHQLGEPDVLPNNAMIMCFARRERVVPFRDAIPGFYANRS